METGEYMRYVVGVVTETLFFLGALAFFFLLSRKIE